MGRGKGGQAGRGGAQGSEKPMGTAAYGGKVYPRGEGGGLGTGEISSDKIWHTLLVPQSFCTKNFFSGIEELVPNFLPHQISPFQISHVPNPPPLRVPKMAVTRFRGPKTRGTFDHRLRNFALFDFVSRKIR